MFYLLFTLQKYCNNPGLQKVFPYSVRENPYITMILWPRCRMLHEKMMYLCNDIYII